MTASCILHSAEQAEVEMTLVFTRMYVAWMLQQLFAECSFLPTNSLHLCFWAISSDVKIAMLFRSGKGDPFCLTLVVLIGLFGLTLGQACTGCLVHGMDGLLGRRRQTHLNSNCFIHGQLHAGGHTMGRGLKALESPAVAAQQSWTSGVFFILDEMVLFAVDACSFTERHHNFLAYPVGLAFLIFIP